MKNLFLNNSTIQEHITAQSSQYAEYMANLLLLFHEYNTEFTIIKLAKILVASLIRKDKQLACYLLKNERYNLPVILKCCEVLDSKRLFTQLSKKTDKIKDKKKLSKHKTILANLKSLNEGLEIALTKGKVRFLKSNWVQHISTEQLEFMALLYPIKQWRFLINLFHLKPGDFQLSWFTTYIFTQEVPLGSIVDICLNLLTSETIKEVLAIYKLPYDFLRLKYKDLLIPEILNIVFDYTPLDNLVRHWDKFNTEDNIQKIINRLDSEELKMPYGELMKRIQMFNESNKVPQLAKKLLQIAETKLSDYVIDIEQPVVVLGDASGSMEIAIKTSSIITSILVKVCNAKMHLFRTKDEPILVPPMNVQEVLDTMTKFKAYNQTAPVASLYPYYEKKEIIKTFIIVTDEEENCGIPEFNNGKGSFAQLYKKYREEIYPSKLVFVSFLKNNKDGYMVSELKRLIPGIDKDIVRFLMNNKNPDLRKLDELLNTLSINADMYNDKCSRLIDKINNAPNLFDDKAIENLLTSDNCIEIWI